MTRMTTHHADPRGTPPTDTNSDDTPSGNELARRGLAIARYALTALACIWLAGFIGDNAHELAALGDRVSKTGLAAAIGVAVVGLLPGALAWTRIAQGFERGLGTVEGTIAYLRSSAGKYTPGGALCFLMQRRDLTERGLTLPRLVSIFAVTAIASIVSASIVGLPAATLVFPLPLIALGALAGLVGIAAAVALAQTAFGRRWIARGETALGATLRTIVPAAIRSVPLLGVAWAISGLHVVALAADIAGGVTLVEGALIVSAYAFACVVGVVFAALPGAVGIKDGALAMTLVPVLGAPAAAFLTVASRILIVAVDVAATAVLTAGRGLRGTSTPQPA